MPSLPALPRDTVLVLLSFVAPCVAPVVTCCSSMWRRLFNDPHVWRLAIARLQASKAGRTRIRAHAAVLIAKCPELNYFLPLPLQQSAPCRYMVLSPDGRYAAVTDGISVRIEVLADANGESESHNVPRSFTVLETKCAKTGMTFSRDGKMLACASSGCIDVIDTASWSLHVRLNNGLSWHKVAFLSDGALASGSENVTEDGGNLVIWDAVRDQGRLRAIGVMRFKIKCIAGSPAADASFACGHKNGALHIFNAHGAIVKDLVGHTRTVTDVKYTSDARSLVSTSSDLTAKVFGVETGACTHSFSADKPFMSVDLRHGLLLLACWTNEVHVYALDGATGQYALRTIVHVENPWTLHISPVLLHDGGGGAATGKRPAAEVFCNSENAMVKFLVRTAAAR